MFVELQETADYYLKMNFGNPDVSNKPLMRDCSESQEVVEQ